MNEPTSFAPESLLAHVEWVRRLAATLVSGAIDADDVAQETWRVALEHPPRHAAQLRHWLALVTRNVARTLGAGERVRSRREGRIVPPGHAPSAAEMVERAHLQRRVVGAVLALEEPYRATLLWRFFEDLAPSVIAARTGVPVETVKTRLKRGLAQLRERLREEFDGEQRDGLRALLPLLAPLATGAIFMTKSKLALAAAAMVIGALAWRFSIDDVAERPVDASRAAVAAAANASDGPAPIPAFAPERAELAAPRADAPSTNATTSPSAPTPALSGFVHTADGEPVAGATILLGRASDRRFQSREDLLGNYVELAAYTGSGELSHHVAQSDAEGRFAIDVVEPGVFAIGAIEPGLGVAWKLRLAIEKQRPATVDLLLEPGTVISGRIYRPDGAPCARATLHVGVFRDARDAEGTGRGVGRLIADASGEYRTLALPYPAFEIRASTLEPTRSRTAAPASSGIVEVTPGEREHRIDVTLAPVVTVSGRLLLKEASGAVGGDALAQRLRALFTAEELASHTAGALGVFGITADPRSEFSNLTMVDPSSALGNTYVNGRADLHWITWISGSIDLEQATYTLRLVESGVTHLAVIARKTLLASAEIPPMATSSPVQEGPDLVLDLGELPPPLSRGRILVHVVDEATGDPIGGGNVVANVVSRDGDLTMQMDQWFGVRDDGSAEVDVRGGEITLSAFVDGFVSTTQTVLLRDRAREERTLRVARATRKVLVRIVAPAGRLLTQPELRAYRRVDGEWVALSSEAKLDGSRGFAFDRLPDGELLIAASSSDLAPAFATTATSGDVELTLTPEAGVVVTLRAVSRDERTLGGVRYRIVDENQVPLIDDVAVSGNAFHDADSWPAHLPPGNYQLEAYAVGCEPARASLQVAGDSSLELGMHARRR